MNIFMNSAISTEVIVCQSRFKNIQGWNAFCTSYHSKSKYPFAMTRINTHNGCYVSIYAYKKGRSILGSIINGKGQIHEI